MSTREEIEAAERLLLSAELGEVTQELVCAGQLLAREVAAEQAERQRRIEAAANRLAEWLCPGLPTQAKATAQANMRDIITRCLDGEIT